MDTHVYRFGTFTLDVANRRLLDGDVPVEVGSRYLDALSMLVSEAGNLVSKQKLVDGVWHGVPITDEAITQAVRVLRRRLGDSAARPRYIQTVAKHGYCFIAPVQLVDSITVKSTAPNELAPSQGAGLARAILRDGTLSAAAAGAVGGLIYGLIEASSPMLGGSSGFSVVAVYVCISTLIALLGGAGVSAGVALYFLGGRHPNPAWVVLGGAAGGALVGALVKLIGVDAFNLLFGASPRAITGAFEGMALGGAIGLACYISCLRLSLAPFRAALVGALATGVVGAIIPLLGGRMMGGSLEMLTQSFPDSQLTFGRIGLLLGDNGFHGLTQAVTGGLEGLLFGGCIVAGIARVCMRR